MWFCYLSQLLSQGSLVEQLVQLLISLEILHQTEPHTAPLEALLTIDLRQLNASGPQVGMCHGPGGVLLNFHRFHLLNVIDTLSHL